MRSWRSITFVIAVVLAGRAAGVDARERFIDSAVIDLALTFDGRLIGRCQNHDEQYVAGVAVDLSQDGTLVARVRSRPDGTFVFADVAAGVYELSSTDWRRPVRIWAADAAPPAAHEPIVILLHQPVPRRREDNHWNEFAPLPQSEEFTEIPEGATNHAVWTELAPLTSDEAMGGPIPHPGTRSPFPPDSFEGTAAAQVDDEAFYPFDTPPPPQPVPEIIDVGGPVTSPTFSPPARYPAGPTIGEVVTAATVITSVALSAVALDEAGDLRDRIRRISSP